MGMKTHENALSQWVSDRIKFRVHKKKYHFTRDQFSIECSNLRVWAVTEVRSGNIPEDKDIQFIGRLRLAMDQWSDRFFSSKNLMRFGTDMEIKSVFKQKMKQIVEVIKNGRQMSKVPIEVDE
jgi:hypothetical protein